MEHRKKCVKHLTTNKFYIYGICGCTHAKKKEDDYEPNITLVLAWYCSPISLPVSGYGKFHHTIATKGVPQTSCQHQRQFGCQSNTLALTAAVSVKSKKNIEHWGKLPPKNSP